MFELRETNPAFDEQRFIEAMNDLILHIFITVICVIGGVQDWRTRQVSNWITLPIFVSGITFNFTRLFNGERTLFTFIILVQALTFVLGWAGYSGGADVKVQAGLIGLWPLGGLAAYLASGVWGAGCLLMKKKTFPAITISSAAIILTALAEVYIITLNLRCSTPCVGSAAPFFVTYFQSKGAI